MGSKVVPFVGPMDAKIYIVGEAPGETEEMEGIPFVGGAGRVLNKFLMDSGISRGECRIGNVMKVRPPANNFGVFYTDKQMRIPTPELEQGRRGLNEDIGKVRPNVVVALGNEALMALFGHRGITDWRGSVLWHRGLRTKVVPTVHPAMVMRQWGFAPLSLFDFKRVKEESLTSMHIVPIRDFIIAPTFEIAMGEIDRLRRSKGRIAFDVETSGTLLTAIALADSPSHAISIPFTYSKGTETIAYFPVEEELAILMEIKGLLEDKGVEKVAQNAQFDTIILKVNPPYIDVQGLVQDTMCSHVTVYPELPKGLDVLCSLYTRQPYYKDWIGRGNDEEFWKYNAMDAVVTWQCAQVLDKEMEEFGVKGFYTTYVHPLIPILADMQIRGVKVDQTLRLQASADMLGEVASMTNSLNGILGKEVNVMSPKQLKQLLYVDMGLPVKYNRARGTESTDEEALEGLAKSHPSPIFDLILGIRHRRKLLGTYLNEGGEGDGRIRCSYLIRGTKTGRLSSRESIFGSGTNLQNIPKGVCRRMFIADEGEVFIEADLSQAEARVVAHLAGEERLIRLFKEGGDIHRQTASWLFSKPIGEIQKGERELAKRLVHASNYGIGPRTFAHHAGVTEGEASLLLQRYFDTFPAIRRWQLEIQSQLGKSKVLCTPLGRKRMFFGRWGEELFREAYSYIPQATVADVLNLALIRYVGWGLPGEVMLQIHDAFVVQCTPKESDTVISCFKEVFDIPIPIRGEGLVIPVSIKIGPNWQDMVEVKVGENGQRIKEEGVPRGKE